jgi:hypothetical protein
MKLRNVLGKTTELGIGMIAIAIMVLAGCGGGGGGGSSSSAACTATGTVSGAAAVDCFFAEAETSWEANLISGMPNWAGTSSAIAQASTNSFVATGANTYTYKPSYMDLATSSAAWSTGTLPASYYLAATGWQPYDSISPSYTNNGNGTITGNSTGNSTAWFHAEITALARTDLTGQPVACTNPSGSKYLVGENIGSASMPVIVTAASCPVAVTYPAGSASYTTTANVTTTEFYFLSDLPTPITLTDGAGFALSALPGIGSQFCQSGMVYDPITNAAAGADNYNVYYSYTSSSCTAANITAALVNPKLGTSLISLKATGNSAVPNLLDIKRNDSSGTYEGIYAFHQGKLMFGSYSPATTSTSTSTSINKTAASAQLRANGLPPLP